MFLFSSRKRRHQRLDPDDFTELAILLGLLLALLIIALARLRPFLVTTGAQAKKREKRLPETGCEEETPSAPQPVEADSGPAPSSLPPGEQLFRAELAEGLMRHDPELGFTYVQPPGRPDDLTRIKGVGQVLAGRLNEWGVYQFAQIALWSRKNLQEIGNRLSFSERIERDDWVGQARVLWQTDRDNAD